MCCLRIIFNLANVVLSPCFKKSYFVNTCGSIAQLQLTGQRRLEGSKLEKHCRLPGPVHVALPLVPLVPSYLRRADKTSRR